MIEHGSGAAPTTVSGTERVRRGWAMRALGADHGDGDGGPSGGALRSRALATLVAVLAVTAAAAFVVGQRFRTPGQEAARARPPAPSLITAAVQRTRPRAGIVFRATVGYHGTVKIAAPDPPSGSLPVITALTVRAGQAVASGTVLMALAERPLVVLDGRIPAFRALQYGDAGSDVFELQAALAGIGFSSYPDSAGSYGLGTGHAVAELYRVEGYTPETTSTTIRVSAKRSRRVQVAEVPLGEIAFVPDLPRTLVRLPVHLGEQLDASKSGPVAELASRGMILTGSVDANTGSLVQVGARGRAVSDLSGRSVPVRVAHIKTVGAGQPDRIVLEPTGTAAASFVGQNVAVHLAIGRGSGRQWVVPVAAVVTDANGHSFVVAVKRNHQQRIAVRPGLSYLGHEIVHPVTGGLYSGEQVVVGSSA